MLSLFSKIFKKRPKMIVALLTLFTKNVNWQQNDDECM